MPSTLYCPLRFVTAEHKSLTLGSNPLPVEQRDPKTHNSLFIPISHYRTAPILHQPQISQNFVNFAILGLFLNGIPVSGPPFFGERPYPRQFHPVEKPLILARFSVAHHNLIITNPYYTWSPTPLLSSQRYATKPIEAPIYAINPYPSHTNSSSMHNTTIAI